MTSYHKQWMLDREQGKGPRLVPSGPATEHVRALASSGASQAAIAEAVGTSADVISRMLNHPRPTVQAATEQRILALTLGDVVRRKNPAGFVPAIGARRRIRALLALGWTHQHITEHMTGVGTVSRVALHERGEWIARATHDAVVAAYDALSMTPGPSRITRGRAASLGYAPPLAWDEGAIDDPQAKPDGSKPRNRRADLDEWVHLVRLGELPTRAAERIGVSLEAVERTAHRNGRADVLGLLAEAREVAA